MPVLTAASKWGTRLPRTIDNWETEEHQPRARVPTSGDLHLKLTRGLWGPPDGGDQASSGGKGK